MKVKTNCNIFYSTLIWNMPVIYRAWFSELHHNPSILTELLMNCSQSFHLTQCFIQTESENEQMKAFLKILIKVILLMVARSKLVLPFPLGYWHTTLHCGLRLKAIYLSPYKVPAKLWHPNFHQISSQEKIF